MKLYSTRILIATFQDLLEKGIKDIKDADLPKHLLKATTEDMPHTPPSAPSQETPPPDAKPETSTEGKNQDPKAREILDRKTPGVPDNIREYIWEILLYAAKGVDIQARAYLGQITVWKDEVTGKVKKPGLSDVSELTDKQLYTIMKKAKLLLENK